MDRLAFAKQLDRFPRVRSRDWVAQNTGCCPVLVSGLGRSEPEPAGRSASRRIGTEPEYASAAEGRSSASAQLAGRAEPGVAHAAPVLFPPVKEFWSGLNGLLGQLIPAAADRRGALESLEEAHFALVEGTNYEDAETLCALVAAAVDPPGTSSSSAMLRSPSWPSSSPR